MGNNIKLTKLKDQIDSFLNSTISARLLSERDRDFKDGYQWTSEEINVLESRKQAAIVVNRVKSKVEGLKGFMSSRNTDIKAYPRNMGSDEKAAHAITDALRYVEDNNNFQDIKLEVFENNIVEGYGAVSIDVVLDGEEPTIKINLIPWDRFYFDPHSSRKDFKDARFMGEMMWVYKDQLLEMYPDKEEVINNVEVDNLNFEAFEDKPNNSWYTGLGKERRYRIVKHYFIDKGIWNVAVFVGDSFLEEPKPIPYLDEKDRPVCPIEGITAYIDRQNLRYGEVRAYIDLQKELNHRRSKALFLLSARQILLKKGSVNDVNVLMRELKKPDGVIEVNMDDGLKLLDTNDFTQGQLALYQDAKAELDASSFNAQLAGERQSGDLSGRAIDKLQSAGSLEINSLFKGMLNWEKRVYEQVWFRIKQFWNEEKWIRITDDQDSIRWAGLNTKITLKKYLEEQIDDESLPLEQRIGANFTLQTMLQSQDPRLETIIEVQNDTTELDVDIKLDQSFDVVNMQQEQFQILAQFAQSSKDIDIIELIELSNLRNKDQLIDKIEKRRVQAAQANGNLQQVQAQELEVKNAKTFADAQVATKKAEQMAIENQILINRPDQRPQVNV